jgi:FKBP-type peptidyl-prolyl cis-trans isomerase
MRPFNTLHPYGPGILAALFMAITWGVPMMPSVQGAPLTDRSTATPHEGIRHLAFLDGNERNAGRKYLADKNQREATAFLQGNATKEGIVTTPSGLQYQIITPGTGPSPTAQDRVEVHYTGQFLNGRVFDSSLKRGRPAIFPLNGVIPGWTEGIQYMKVGAKYRFFIPPALGYGEQGAGQGMIPPNAALIFDVELLAIK